MTDSELVRWISRHKPEIQYHTTLPNGQPWYKPWWVAVPGQNPLTGQTLRIACERAERFRLKLLRKGKRT